MVTKYGVRFSDKIWGNHHHLIKRLARLFFVKITFKGCIPWSNSNQIKGSEVENFVHDSPWEVQCKCCLYFIVAKFFALKLRRHFSNKVGRSEETGTPWWLLFPGDLWRTWLTAGLVWFLHFNFAELASVVLPVGNFPGGYWEVRWEVRWLCICFDLHHHLLKETALWQRQSGSNSLGPQCCWLSFLFFTSCP